MDQRLAPIKGIKHLSDEGFSFPNHSAIRVNLERPGAACSNFGVRFHKSELLGQPFRPANIVTVHASNVFPLRQIEAPIKTPRQTRIMVVTCEDYSTVGIFLNDRGTMVCGSVVDDDEFKIGEGLTEDAVNRLAQVPFTVVH